ncbi:LOW QUALITY PROTEIN: E3 ubiquitin/ISG15 ligase TRIM25-like [Pelodytes ibericus]
MAAAGLAEELSCSICLNIYKNPVMLTCGHNFCNHCITIFFDHQQESGIYSCPECREISVQRPLQLKNLKLSNIVEHYCALGTEPVPQVAKVAKIPCTYCVDSERSAVKTCLHCEASLCDMHLKNHSTSEKHILTEPTNSLKDLKCPLHNELLQFYCSNDSSFMCVTCKTDGKHKGHNVETLNEAFQKKKKHLGDFLGKITVRMTEYRNKLQQVENQKQTFQGKVGAMKGKVHGLFEDIRKEILALENKVSREISRQEEVGCQLLSNEIQAIEKKTDELHKKKLHIEQLCDVTDPLTLLKEGAINTNLGNNYYVNSHLLLLSLDETLIAVILERSLKAFTDSLSKLKSDKGFFVNTTSDLILNVNTAEMSSASWCDKEKSRPFHPERFVTQQVLSTNTFSSGKHYWEVKTSDTGNWSVGVTYNSVRRKGETSFIGKNPKSWCLFWCEDELFAEHDAEQEDLSFCSPDLGIYLDYDGGFLSFYTLSEPITHIHTFTAVFTEPLHAAFYLDEGAVIKIVS